MVQPCVLGRASQIQYSGHLTIILPERKEEQIMYQSENTHKTGHDGKTEGLERGKNDPMSMHEPVQDTAANAELQKQAAVQKNASGKEMLPAGAIGIMAEALNCKEEDIHDIQKMDKGMSNKSFTFLAAGKKYILRVLGEGQRRLSDRREEEAAYKAIAGCGLCDDPVYLSAETGYKITAFLEGVRSCDPKDPHDVSRCMDLLRHFHELHLTVPHTFDLRANLIHYEDILDGHPCPYPHFQETKERVFSLLPILEKIPVESSLTHIDPGCDNFLFYRPEGSQEEKLQLCDWEYASMQDPHMDIAMFALYAFYNKQELDWLTDLYFKGDPGKLVRTKLYCYMSAYGYLWSLFAEYKRLQGIDFGDYGLGQFNYADEFYRYALDSLK